MYGLMNDIFQPFIPFMFFMVQALAFPLREIAVVSPPNRCNNLHHEEHEEYQEPTNSISRQAAKIAKKTNCDSGGYQKVPLARPQRPRRKSMEIQVKEIRHHKPTDLPLAFFASLRDMP